MVTTANNKAYALQVYALALWGHSTSENVVYAGTVWRKGGLKYVIKLR